MGNERSLAPEAKEELEKIKDTAFQNMGHFYVVGNEIVKAILQKKGIENLKKLMDEARHRPCAMLELYKKISAGNQGLVKIIF